MNVIIKNHLIQIKTSGELLGNRLCLSRCCFDSLSVIRFLLFQETFVKFISFSQKTFRPGCSFVTNHLLSSSLIPHLCSIVHPRTEFEVAGLIVEWKIHNVDWTRGPELGWRGPEHVSGVVNYRKTSEIPFGVVISTRKELMKP